MNRSHRPESPAQHTRSTFRYSPRTSSPGRFHRCSTCGSGSPKTWPARDSRDFQGIARPAQVSWPFRCRPGDWDCAGSFHGHSSRGHQHPYSRTYDLAVNSQGVPATRRIRANHRKPFDCNDLCLAEHIKYFPGRMPPKRLKFCKNTP